MRARILLATSVTAAVALLGAGCSGGGDDSSAATTTSSSAPATTVAVSTTGAAATTTVSGATTVPTTVPVPTGVVLRPDGLGVVAFGATKDATLAALDAAFGSVDESGTGCELAGPDVTTARWDELRVQFVGQAFDSYNVRPPNGVEPVLGLKTEAGVGVGSTVAQLQAAYGSRLTIPGLAPEFGGDDFAVSFPGTDRKIFGSLSNTTPAGAVRAVFTQVCE